MLLYFPLLFFNKKLIFYEHFTLEMFIENKMISILTFIEIISTIL